MPLLFLSSSSYNWVLVRFMVDVCEATYECEVTYAPSKAEPLMLYVSPLTYTVFARVCD